MMKELEGSTQRLLSLMMFIWLREMLLHRIYCDRPFDPFFLMASKFSHEDKGFSSKIVTFVWLREFFYIEYIVIG